MENKTDKIPLWLYWEKSSQACKNTPALIKLCRKTVAKYCREDFDIRLVGPLEVKKLVYISEEVWGMSNIAMRADVIRARLLQKYGGLWLDSDLIVLKSLKEVKDKLKKYEFVGYKKESYGDSHIPNNFFACKPNCNSINNYVREQNKRLYQKGVLDWNELGAKALTGGVENAYLYKENKIQPIPWQEQSKFYKSKEVKLPKDSLVCVYFNNAQASRDYIPDLRYIISEEKALKMDIALIKILKKALYD